ncbi:MAG: isopenicillin N synthase family oxygenase, partial [Candidatus Tectomicrobia bacterium]|nr:isopenicillin N synthase family oxygenase [Candidatus Tectomicrobia bacterium]
QEGTAEAKQQVAREVLTACETLGFLIISGHGIAPEIFDRAFSAAFAFYDLPLHEKQRAAAHSSGQQRGYAPFASKGLAATLGQEAPPDLRESFFLGPLDDHREQYAHDPNAAVAYRDNIWPRQPHDFQSHITAYYRAMEHLGQTLMAIFATALGLPQTYFNDKIDRHFSIYAAHHYPVPSVPPLPGQLRTGAHTDFGSLTILACTDAPGGLQVQVADDQWCDVQPGAGELIVNLGDMMARWTNDGWKSTLHRVVNPPAENAAGSRRLSMGYFMHPNYDARIETLPGCSSPDHPPMYAPITAGRHIREKIEASYLHQR